MASSASRRRKQPARRPVLPAARAARPSLLPSLPPVDGDLDDPYVDPDQDEEDDEAEPKESDGSLAGAATRGIIRRETWARSRVPYALQEVISAKVQVARAERVLVKKAQAARRAGATWDEIGLATGMTRQGATKRFR